MVPVLRVESDRAGTLAGGLERDARNITDIALELAHACSNDVENLLHFFLPDI
jgi:hypothetical protein